MRLFHLFHGRIAPGYYFAGILFFAFVQALLALVVIAILGPDSLLSTSLRSALLLVNLVLTFSLVVRRLHDLHRSGYYSLALFFPVINFFVGLWTLFARGDREATIYGPAPTHKTFFSAILNLS